MKIFLIKILPILLGLVGFLILIRNRKKYTKYSLKWTLWLSALIFCSIYFVYTAIAYGMDTYYKMDYSSFDLNNNGNMELSEWTDEAKIAMEKVTGDTARTFAPIIGLIFSTVVSIIVLISGIVWSNLLKKTAGKTTHNNA
ncbi:hypothetical protein ZONE111905_11020 [Zobellia nedashkovskayae]